MQKVLLMSFLKPIIVSENNNLPTAKIEENDVVFCFNFRTDRGREITEVLSQQDFPRFWNEKIESLLCDFNQL